MENTKIFPNLSTLGGTSFVNFPEHISGEAVAVFIQACNHRITMLEHLIGETVREYEPELTRDKVYYTHSQALAEFQDGNVYEEDFYAAFGHLYYPVNIVSVHERITAYEKASEFAQFAAEENGISDLQLYTYLYRTPSSEPYTPEETAAEIEKINQINKQREIMGLSPIYEDTEELIFSHEKSPLDSALDYTYENAITEVFELFRACQFEMLNKWEKKAMVWQMRETTTEPVFTHEDPENRNSIHDLFESNIIMLLRHNESFGFADKSCGTNAGCSFLNDNIMSGFFENAQIFLQFSFEEGAKTPYGTVFDKYDGRFYRPVSENEYNRYKSGISDKTMRFELEEMEPGQTLKTAAYSSLFFSNLTEEGKENFDRYFNKEITRIAAENGFGPPPPAAYFREKSLKYDMYLK